MHSRSLHLFILTVIGLALPCHSQSGVVTFYSIHPGPGQQIADEVVPFGKAAFAGLLYDGGQRLAHAQGGRFMTFRLPVGEHLFSASYHTLSPGDPSVNLKVEDGGHYCVRLSSNYKSGSIVVPLAHFHSHIEQVPCDAASKEAARYKQLELKRIEATARTELVSTQSFPAHD